MKFDVIDPMIIGDIINDIFTGMNKLLSKDWSLDVFIKKILML